MPTHCDPSVPLICLAALNQFEPISLFCLTELVHHLQPTNCPSNHIPSCLLKEVYDIFETLIPTLINNCLVSACVPAAFKHTLVQNLIPAFFLTLDPFLNCLSCLKSWISDLAAFNNVDHEILVQSGFKGTVLRWFQSCLTDKCFSVQLGNYIPLRRAHLHVVSHEVYFYYIQYPWGPFLRNITSRSIVLLMMYRFTCLWKEKSKWSLQLLLDSPRDIITCMN